MSNPTSVKHSSPFGILPHESVAVSSPPGPQVTKTPNSVPYDNSYATHYSSNGIVVTGTEPKTGAWPTTDVTSKSRSQSPTINNKCTVTESSIPGTHTYFQATNAYDSNGLTANYSAENQSSTNVPVVQSSLHHQSCIVTTPNHNLSNRIPQISSRSPVPTTNFLNVPPQDKQTVAGKLKKLNFSNSGKKQHTMHFCFVYLLCFFLR